jgi:hypothetical protein
MIVLTAAPGTAVTADFVPGAAVCWTLDSVVFTSVFAGSINAFVGKEVCFQPASLPAVWQKNAKSAKLIASSPADRRKTDSTKPLAWILKLLGLVYRNMGAR